MRGTKIDSLLDIDKNDTRLVVCAGAYEPLRLPLEADLDEPISAKDFSRRVVEQSSITLDLESRAPISLKKPKMNLYTSPGKKMQKPQKEMKTSTLMKAIISQAEE
jgi:hypothetical protein